MSDSTRLAVLIDADNTSASHASAILEEVARYGVPTVKRAYGDWTTQNLVRWKDELHRHAVQPVQQFAYDREELHRLGADHRRDGPALLRQRRRLRDRVERQRLHPAGHPAAGVRQDRLRPRPPPYASSLVAACDRFIYLEVLGRDSEATEPADEPDDDQVAAPLPDLGSMLVAAIDSTLTRRRLDVALGGRQPHQPQQPVVRPAQLRFPKLVELARAQEYVDVDQSPDAPVRVRLTSSRPAKKSSARGSVDEEVRRAQGADGVLHAGHDPHVAHGTTVEGGQRVLVGGAVVRGRAASTESNSMTTVRVVSPAS